MHSSSLVSQLRVHGQSTSGQRSSDEQFGVHADHRLSKPLDLPQSLVRATTSDSTTMFKGSLGGETSVLRTFRMSGKELVKERVSEGKS